MIPISVVFKVFALLFRSVQCVTPVASLATDLLSNINIVFGSQSLYVLIKVRSICLCGVTLRSIQTTQSSKLLANFSQSMSLSALFISLGLSILAFQLENCNFSYPDLLHPSCNCICVKDKWRDDREGQEALEGLSTLWNLIVFNCKGRFFTLKILGS